MPTATYDLITETTLGSNSASVTISSIPSTYKDFVVEYIGSLTSSPNDIWMYFNGDETANYNRTWFSTVNQTSSPTAGSGRNTGIGGHYVFYGGTTLSYGRVEVFSYANTNVNKSVLSRGTAADTASGLVTSMWRSTAAVNSIKLTSPVNFTSGSIFRVWGIVG